MCKIYAKFISIKWTQTGKISIISIVLADKEKEFCGGKGSLRKGALYIMKYNRNVYRSLVMITQFGLNMLVPIVLCTFAGNFINKKLGTSFFVIIFFFAGALAGFRNIFMFARKIYEDKEKPDEKTKRRK